MPHRKPAWPALALVLTCIAVLLPAGARAAGSTTAPASSDRLFSDAELRAKYARAPSQFVEIAGTTIHLRDEGSRSRPALLLVNGHLGSLHMWDAWMPQLLRHFRVIRIDYAPYGLSGPNADGRYSTRGAVAQVLALADRLGLERFHIGGTSNGALVALFFAIEHPQRVDRLVVSTLPAGRPPPRQPAPALLAAAAEAKRIAPVQPRAFFDAFLHDILANDAVIDEALVDRYWMLNNRAGAKAHVDAYIQDQYVMWDTLDVKSYYARLSRPMLLQWGADGIVLPRRIGEEVAALFEPGIVKLVQYPNAAHLPMIEQPQATVRDAIRFLRESRSER